MYKPPRCKDCEYWRKDSKVKVKSNKAVGECKKSLPILGPNGYGYWPLTKSDDFCYCGTRIDENGEPQLICEDQKSEAFAVPEDGIL